MPILADWGPVRQTYGGIKEIDSQWVAENLDQVNVLDVRETEEFDGDLGHIDGAHLIPLAELDQRVQEVETQKPIVTVCKSGRRSAQATVILKRQGITNAASMRGGMLQWHDASLPVQ